MRTTRRVWNFSNGETVNRRINSLNGSFADSLITIVDPLVRRLQLEVALRRLNQRVDLRLLGVDQLR